MKVRIAREALRLIEGCKDPSPEMKVSGRWLRASLAVDYDLLIRLQILEGVAKVPVDSWWKKPKSVALAKIKKFFEGASLNPGWLLERSQSLYNVLQRNLNGAIHSYRLPLEPFDVINNTLMGIPLDPTSDERIERAPYLAGKYLAEKIKQGEETPESVAAGVLSTMLKRKVQNLSRHRFEQLSEDDKGGTRDVTPNDMIEGWGPSEEATASEYLSNIFFSDLSDPLGKEIRNFMRKIWTANPSVSRAKTMPYWLDRLETKKTTEYATVANQFNITAQGFYQNHWLPAWRDFFNALWANPSLMGKINSRLRDHHLEPLQESLPKDVLNKILPPKRKASSLDRVASIYFFRSI